MTFSKKTISRSACFNAGPSNHLEFTHIDPLDETGAATLQSRVERMLAFRGSSGQVIFSYHHRSTNGFVPEIKKRILDGLSFLQSLYCGSRAFVFTQRTVNAAKDRGFDLILENSKAVFCEVRTLHAWGGDDQEIFWGRNDNDIFREMLPDVQKALGLLPTAKLASQRNFVDQGKY